MAEPADLCGVFLLLGPSRFLLKNSGLDCIEAIKYSLKPIRLGSGQGKAETPGPVAAVYAGDSRGSLR